MSALYDHSVFQREVFYDQLEVGQSFPTFRYRLTREHIASYLSSVDEPEEVEGKANYLGGSDRADSLVVPTLVALNYGFVYSAMQCRPPTGFLNSATSFEFVSPVLVDADLVMHVSVASKEVKRGRKYVVLRADVSNVEGERKCSASISCVFPG
jgi:hypothetical protein